MPPKAVKAVIAQFTNEQITNAATGRWGDIAHEVKPAEPYVIDTPDGGKITISPMTRRRRKTLKAAQAAYLMTGAQLIEAQRDDNADQQTITRIQQILDEAERTYDEALFGDACAAVTEYFEDQQEEYWDAMYADVHEALVNRVPIPDGVCPKCGQEVDVDPATGEGKDESSSTSLIATGTS